MSKPLVVTISHSLGRDQAVARLKDRIGTVRETLSQYRVAVVKDEWNGNRLDFEVSALGQNVLGAVDVGDDSIRIEVRLPWLLGAFAERLQSVVHKRAPALLGHDPKRD